MDGRFHRNRHIITSHAPASFAQDQRHPCHGPSSVGQVVREVTAKGVSRKRWNLLNSGWRNTLPGGGGIPELKREQDSTGKECDLDQGLYGFDSQPQ